MRRTNLGPQRIPAHARRVFRGVVFDIYQWKQKMFDGSFATFEIAKRTYSVTIIPVTVSGKILMTAEQQPGKPPFIGVPGGMINAGETPREAASRELLEETGYTARKLVPWFSYQPGSRVDWEISLFIAHDCRKTRAPHLDAGEKITVNPVSFEQFAKRMTTHNVHARNREIVTELLHARLDRSSMKRLRRRILGK